MGLMPSRALFCLVIGLAACESDRTPAEPELADPGVIPSLTMCVGDMSGGCGFNVSVSPNLQQDPYHGKFATSAEQIDSWGLPVMPFPASDPFDITFSQPVIGLNISGVSYGLANGLVVPSSATMIVYDVNGNILATVPPYYVTPWDQPSSYAQWSFGYPPNGQPVVARVHFDPAGEHLPVLMNFTASIPGPAQMSCTPASVVRGDLVRCEVTDGSNVQVTGWSFTTNETPAHVINGPSSSLIWAGVIAVGGTASVTLTDGGSTKTLTASVAVAARNWSQLTVNHTATEVFTPLLPNPPTAEGDLGDHLPLAGTNILSDG